MLNSAINLGLLALSALALYGFGAAILRASRLQLWAVSARLAYALAFGLGVLVLALFGLGLVGWLRSWSAWALLVIGLALLPFSLPLTREVIRALWVRVRQLGGADWGVWAMIGLFALQAALHALADLAPPVEGDTVNSYLLTPRYWAQAGRYWQPAHIWASTLPGHLMMLSTWGLLLRGTSPEALLHGYSLATLLTGFLMSLFLALGVYALARVRYGGRVGLLAATIIFLMPDASYLAESGKVDLGWAFFETLALAALFHWSSEKTRSRRWLALAGVCAGLALGAKSQAVMSLPFLAGWIVVIQMRRGRFSETLPVLAIFGLAALVIGAPYLAYNTIVHRNPTYPVLASQFARLLNGTPASRSELGTEVFYAWTPGGYLLNLWDASLGHPPPFYLGFWAGPAYLILLPLGLLLGKRERVTDGLLLYAFLFSIAWFLTKQAVRHFLPGLALLAVVAGYVLRRLDEEPSWLRHAVYAALAPSLAVGVAFMGGIVAGNGAHLAALGMLSPEAYVARWTDDVAANDTFPDSEVMSYLNTHASPGERVLTRHAHLSLYFQTDLVARSNRESADVWVTSDEATLLRAFDERGIDYLLIFKSDLQSAEQNPNSDLPLFSQPAFYEDHAELVLETRRTFLYRWRP
jgi:hypothetical protein